MSGYKFEISVKSFKCLRFGAAYSFEVFQLKIMLTLYIFAVVFNYDFAIKTIKHWISLSCTLLCRIQPENLKSFIHLHFFSFYETCLIQVEHLEELVSFKAAHPPPLLLQRDY